MRKSDAIARGLKQVTKFLLSVHDDVIIRHRKVRNWVCFTELVLARKTGKTKLRSGESLRFLLNETAGTEISEKIPTETQTPTTTSQSTFDYWNSKVNNRLLNISTKYPFMETLFFFPN